MLENPKSSPTSETEIPKVRTNAAIPDITFSMMINYASVAWKLEIFPEFSW